MKIENSFHVPAGVEQAWAIITDVPRIVSCMPGAELTGTTPEGAFKGKARMKIGPVALEFNGDAQLYDVDPKAHTMKVKARASDAKGRGTVASEMSFMLSPDASRTRVDVLTDLTLTGAVAQYGRGAGLIKEVANQFTRDFAANLESLVRQQAPAQPQKPVSGLSILFRALRAMVARWFGGKQA
ncbi:MAG TPA: SRPBCC family protein [Burkholderiales bacterium]